MPSTVPTICAERDWPCAGRCTPSSREARLGETSWNGTRRRSRGISSTLLLIAAFVLVFAVPSGAQTSYGTILGTVTDSTGAHVPGVEVTVTNVATNISQKVAGNEVANYLVPNLVPGRYRVSAERSGFKKFVAEDVALASTQVYRVDIRLEVGALTESVSVTIGAQLIETERSTVTAVTSREVYTYLPVNSGFRSLWRIMLLTPTVVGGGFGNYIAGNSRGSNSVFTIDGIPMIDGWSGNAIGPAFSYMDSFQEFRVDIAGVNASGGTTANVTAVSEGGTNHLHGEAWLHYGAVGFRARPFFAQSRPSGPPSYRPNLKIGGPVWLPKLYDGRNRTFFHFTYQGLRGSQAPQVSNFVVPSTAFRAGDFSGLATPIRDPLSGSPFALNRIPTARISGVSKYFQDTFYPEANTGVDRFGNVSVFPNLDNLYVGRLDQKITDRNLFFFRAFFHHFEFTQWDGGSNPKIGIYNQFRDQYNVVIADTHTFSPRWINDLRLGYGSDYSEGTGPLRGQDVVRAAGLQLADLTDVKAMPAMSITGFQSLAQTNLFLWKWGNYYLNEALLHTRGRHNFRFGMDLSSYNGRLLNTSPSATYGSYGFNGRFAGNPYADFLLGLMDGSSRSTSVGPVHRHRLNKEFYFTDDFKISSRLSLTYGLRHSLLDPGFTDENLVSNFNPFQKALVVPDAASLGRVHPGFPKNVPIITAQQAGLGRRLVHGDSNNFAPRVGFAWRPGSRNDLVVRGGAGLYYYTQQPNPSEGGGAPYELRENFTNQIVGGVPSFIFPKPFPTTGFVLGGTGAGGLNPYLRTPYSWQYNFAVDKEAFGMGFTLSYIATLSRKNPWTRDLNQVPADARPYAVKLAQVPFPYLFTANFTENGFSHNYHGAFIKAERKLRGGFFYSTNLTWSKSVGDDWGGVEDAFDRRRERSQGGQIPHWRFISSGLYELPLGRGKRFAASAPKAVNHIIGNWMLSGNYVAQTGVWFTPAFSGVDPSNTNRRSGRPDRIADGNLAKGQRTLQRWFDTSAFLAPPAGVGRFGSSGAFILEGPGLNVFHFGANKDIVVHERLRLRLDMVATDFFNHPNFGNPSATIGTSSYGQILGTIADDGNRNFSLTLRVLF